MAPPRIIYNGRDVDLGRGVTMMRRETVMIGSQNTSIQGSRETLILRAEIPISLTWKYLVTREGVADPDRVRQLRQLSDWIQSGGSFAVARDRDKTVNTTLASGVAEGATSVVVASATGIVQGDECVIRDTVRVATVKVASVVGTTVNLTSTEPLDFPFAAGARFRYSEYWPAIAAPGARLIERVSPQYHSAQLDFIEDIDDLAEGAAMLHVDAEIPSGLINGSNAAFSLAHTPLTNSLMLFYRASGSGMGVLWKDGVEYTLSGLTITATVAPLTGDTLTAYYRR